MQSFLEGARDRAIHAKEPRGIRFLRDTQNPSVVTSMLYIGPPENFTEGQILIEFDGVNTPPRHRKILHSSTEVRNTWINLYSRGLIPQNGAVLRIFNSNSKPEFYTMSVSVDGMGNVTDFFLTKDFNVVDTQSPKNYSLQLNPNVLPNQEPRQLPRDVVIDLPNSQIPPDWNLDVLFSPHGTVTGLVSSAGVLHLVVAEGVDVFQGRLPGAFDKEGNERVVTLRTQTGGISVHNVDPTGATATTDATDPFYFAAIGETAK